jgi:CPA1 family monovalent cation:H+ antiporter
LAAALSIPLATRAGTPLPERSLILVVAIAVIVTSLIVQGFTLAPLVTWARIAVPHEDRHQQRRDAWARLAEVGTTHLDERAGTSELDPDLIEQARRAVRATADLATESALDGPAAQYRQLRRDVLSRQIAELNALARAGEVSDAVRRAIQRHLDLETERLRDHR